MSGLELIIPAIVGAASSTAATVGTAYTAVAASTIGQAIAAAAPTISLLSTVASGIGGFATASAQSEAMKTQATNALVQGNQQAMNYQRQAIQVMNRTIETTALINARGAASGIDPFSGSAGALSEYALGKGIDEYNWAQENVQMARLSGRANQAAYRSAAQSYRTQGAFALTSGLLGGLQKSSSLGLRTTPVQQPWDIKSAWGMDRI